ncbi:DUF3363 domain-containing protein [Halotalea alkalilenta]|uniref:DUF3363 domain-containing protein n=1 Tax=Halotalea alkalilenta TaxID=376489 RepID=UPI0009EF491C|nr:DUF3363 domain-containing protein [Halotalea alkalilenta]
MPGSSLDCDVARYIIFINSLRAPINGIGFSLVPWRPVIEQRLGQQLTATARGADVSWEVGRQRGPGIV